MNDNVIITGNSHSENQVYHTDVCRLVWMLSRKRYVPEEHAKQWGLEECTYCAGEFEVGTRRDQTYQLCVSIGKERAGSD